MTSSPDEGPGPTPVGRALLVEALAEVSIFDSGAQARDNDKARVAVSSIRSSRWHSARGTAPVIGLADILRRVDQDLRVDNQYACTARANLLVESASPG